MRVLQTNLGRGRVAHDIAHAVIKDMDIDLLVVSEPNKTIMKGPGWVADERSDVAVYIRNRNIGIHTVRKYHGFLAMNFREFTMYCCYISPNIPLDAYKEQVDCIMNDIKENPREAVVMGDINSKSPEWGSPVWDTRGEYWSEWLAELNLIVNNTGNAPSFVRGDSTSYIDVTCSSQKLARRITEWKIMEKEAMTYHQHIYFEIGPKHKKTQLTENIKPVFYKEKFKTEIRTRMQGLEGATVRSITLLLAEATKASSSNTQTGNNRKAPYWWNQEIDEKRRECTKIKRKLTRLRICRSVPQNVRENLHIEHKRLRKELRGLIIRSKRDHWQQTCSALNEDIWGQGYNIATRWMKRTNTPYNLNVEKKRQIAENLFPRSTYSRGRIEIETETEGIPPFSIEELAMAREGIKEGKSPGPDGIPPEAVKLFIAEFPEIILKVLNNLLKAQEVPEEWKVARLIIIWKSGKPLEDPSSYRPLCLLNVMCKTYESMIKARIELELEEKKSLSDYQFGFRRGRSTVDAVKWVTDKANNSKSKWVLLILLDIKNAFNSANWDLILMAMEERGISGYLINMINSYLGNRRIIITHGEHMQISTGVPQGSVLGPTLWNILYDDILRLKLVEGVRTIAYADDLALYAEAEDRATLEFATNESLRRICRWMDRHELSIAEHKTEAVVLKGPRRREHIDLHIKGTVIKPSKSVKYLGIVLDGSRSFGEHIKLTTKKAEIKTAMLMRIMPNLRGPSSSKRYILYGVIQSILLYGAPVWHEAIKTRKYKLLLEKTQRKMLLRVASAYRTVATKAIQVVTGAVPIDIMAKEREFLYNTRDGHLADVKKAARARSLKTWQEEWDENRDTAQWTKRLIPKLEIWVNCEFRKTDYFTTQFLTGHGSFGYYAKRMGKTLSDACVYCGAVDTAEHTMFHCERWSVARGKVMREVGENLNAQNIIQVMTANKMVFDKVYGYIRDVMTSKENERRRQENAA